MRLVVYRILLATCTAALLHAAGHSALTSALTFHAGFDGSLDASFGSGDRALYTAPNYKTLNESKPGLADAAIEHAKGAGRFGDALRFQKKNVKAVHYKAKGNANLTSGTISFWLRLDPDKELEPGYCDPIQFTDKAFNDDAIWVDFTKDDKPRHFRLGVFGSRAKWNPQSTPEDKNPDFLKRLVIVTKPPFTADKWVHVAIAHDKLGTAAGTATLYLNGAAQGTATGIAEAFTWDPAAATLRLGVNYVGLFDDLSIFSRPLSASEVKTLYGLKNGVKELHK